MVNSSETSAEYSSPSTVTVKLPVALSANLIETSGTLPDLTMTLVSFKVTLILAELMLTILETLS